jgi:hypothetical protein
MGYAALAGGNKKSPSNIRTRRMRPAVPPEFRLKANTLTAYNGANRIGLLGEVHPICSEGKCLQRGIAAFSRGGLLCDTVFLFADFIIACHNRGIVYHIFRQKSRVFSKNIHCIIIFCRFGARKFFHFGRRSDMITAGHEKADVYLPCSHEPKGQNFRPPFLKGGAVEGAEPSSPSAEGEIPQAAFLF